MNALALVPLDGHAPTAATPMERARRLLNALPVHPMQLPTDDPARVLHDLVAGDELEGLLSEERINELRCELEGIENERDDEASRAKLAEDALEDIRRALGSRASGKKDNMLDEVVKDLLDELRPMAQRLRNIRMALGEFGDGLDDGDLADTVRRVADAARKHVAGGAA